MASVARRKQKDVPNGTSKHDHKHDEVHMDQPMFDDEETDVQERNGDFEHPSQKHLRRASKQELVRRKTNGILSDQTNDWLHRAHHQMQINSSKIDDVEQLLQHCTSTKQPPKVQETISALRDELQTMNKALEDMVKFADDVEVNGLPSSQDDPTLPVMIESAPRKFVLLDVSGMWTEAGQVKSDALFQTVNAFCLRELRTPRTEEVQQLQNLITAHLRTLHKVPEPRKPQLMIRIDSPDSVKHDHSPMLRCIRLREYQYTPQPKLDFPKLMQSVRQGDEASEAKEDLSRRNSDEPVSSTAGDDETKPKRKKKVTKAEVYAAMESKLDKERQVGRQIKQKYLDKDKMMALKRPWVKRRKREIRKNNKKFELTVDMMLGIRTMVRRSDNHDQMTAQTPPKEADFLDTTKMEFPPEGSKRTPKHPMKKFEFKDYAGNIFSRLRALSNIQDEEYLASIAGDFPYLDFISNSKSGMFFFYTYDKRFMIKSQPKEESRFFRSILKEYYFHVAANPNTLLSQIYGLHRVSVKGKEIHFIVMGNVFKSDLTIHKRFDLKGSIIGRFATEREKQQRCPVLKDLDFQDTYLQLGSAREAFINQLQADAAFLERMQIMDYSLLVGIHEGGEHEEDEHNADEPHEEQRIYGLADSQEPAINTKHLNPKVKQFLESLDDKQSRKLLEVERAKEKRLQEHEEKYLAESLAHLKKKRDMSKQPEEADSDAKDLSPSRGHRRRHSDVFTFPLERSELRFEGSNYDDDRHSFVESGPVTPINVERIGREPDEEALQPAGNPKSKLTNSPFLSRIGSRQPSELQIKAVRHYPSNDSLEGSFHGGRRMSVPVGPAWSEYTGGFRSRNEDGTPGDEVYYFGIIDILQVYNARKKAEHWFKSLTKDGKSISAVDPKFYSERFVSFISSHLK